MRSTALSREWVLLVKRDTAVQCVPRYFSDLAASRMGADEPKTPFTCLT